MYILKIIETHYYRIQSMSDNETSKVIYKTYFICDTRSVLGEKALLSVNKIINNKYIVFLTYTFLLMCSNSSCML